MNIQYISDNDGLTTGVFIPISEWNHLKSKWEIDDISIPSWQIREAKLRLEHLKQHPETAVDFDTLLDEFENK